MVRLFVVLLLLILSASRASPGAWTLDSGETRTYTTSSFTYGNHGFDDDGKLVKVPEYRKFTLNGALDYGVRPWLTAVLRGELRQEYGYGEVQRLPFVDPIFVEGQTRTRVVYGHRTMNYGNLAGGARFRVLERDHYVGSVEGVASTGGFDSLGTGAPSDGPFVEARALFGIGRPFSGRHLFLNAEAGYRARLEADDKDELVLDLTVGAQVLPRWMVLGQTFSTFEVAGDVHYTKGGASAVYEINDRMRLEIGAVATLHGRNAIQELGGKIGVWWVY